MYRFRAKAINNQETVEGYYYQHGEGDNKKGYIIPVYGHVLVSDKSEAIEVDIYSVEILNDFTLPGKADVCRLDKKSIYGITYSMRKNLIHVDDFVRYTLELGLLTLDSLADNMNDNETLKEFFSRRES